MIVEKIVKLADELDAEGNVVGQIRTVFYKISRLEAAEDENGNPVNIKVHIQTVSKKALLNKHQALVRRRDAINAEIQELVDSYNEIKNNLGDE